MSTPCILSSLPLILLAFLSPCYNQISAYKFKTKPSLLSKTSISLPIMPIDDEIQWLLLTLKHILEIKKEVESSSKACRKLQNNNEDAVAKFFMAVIQFKQIHKHIMDHPDFISILGDDPSYDIEQDIRQLQRHILALKLPRAPKHRPCYHDVEPMENMLDVLHKSPTQSTQQFVLEARVPRFFRNPTFENSAAFRDVEGRYNALPLNLKLCLLCFSVFPIGVIIKKRLMVHWWIAEGFIEQQQGDEKDVEQSGADYFYKLIKGGFIKPYQDKYRLQVQACKMPTFIHSVVTTIAARAKFFDFDSIGRPKDDCPSSFRLALVRTPLLENYKGYDKFHLVFNVSANVLCLSPEWIRTMKNVTVLYLGRWQSCSSYNIKTMDDGFLMALNKMKHLRLLSLQGILGILELPDEVAKLEHLIILDLRACEHLQRLPPDIGLLKSLTHLDLSECYLLYEMPIGLSELKNLLVLKGFVVGETDNHACGLKDLSQLPKLQKLSIYPRFIEFPSQQDLEAFQQFEVLTKLKIAWGGLHGEKVKDTNKKPNDNADSPQLPSKLKKLELQSFPMKTAPVWLNPRNLQSLEKLYITHTKLCDLSGNIGEWDGQVNPWGVVKVLRFKYMPNLAMHWKEVDKLFPELIYLEKVNCPKLSLFPCDEAGVWINKEKFEAVTSK